MSIVRIIQLLGGVGIFLYAIRLISDSLQLMAGDRLRRLIAMLTRTPVLGVLVGTLATMLIQSSSATTVMTVSFVEAGFMTLTQAIGVIMGANIGTTVTGQILAIKIKDYVYIFILVGVLFMFLSKNPRWKNFGSVLIGFGLLFVGMQTMEDATSVLRDQKELFLALAHEPLLGVLAGMVLTLLVQSSSATVGLTIALGMQGLLPLEAAIPIVLGDNIGTTITAVLASIGTSRAAKQACAAHVLFNVIGVSIFLPLMPLYIGFIQSTASSVGHQIANAHSLFNICNTLLFLPFIHPFAALIRRIIPDRELDVVEDLQYLDPKLISVTPVMAVDAVRNQCVHMGGVMRRQLDAVESLFFHGDLSRREVIQSLENRMDDMHKAILAYADDIFKARIPEGASNQLHALLVCSGDMERIGDTGVRMLEFYDYRQNRSRDFSPEAMKELQALYARVKSCTEKAVQILDQGNYELDEEVEHEAEAIRQEEGRLRDKHMERLNAGTCDAETGLVFIEVLSALEHVAYRARKIARGVIPPSMQTA